LGFGITFIGILIIIARREQIDSREYQQYIISNNDNKVVFLKALYKALYGLPYLIFKGRTDFKILANCYFTLLKTVDSSTVKSLKITNHLPSSVVGSSASNQASTPKTIDSSTIERNTNQKYKENKCLLLEALFNSKVSINVNSYTTTTTLKWAIVETGSSFFGDTKSPLEKICAHDTYYKYFIEYRKPSVCESGGIKTLWFH
jgi:hypothetical protein